jgi:hypothetical protein
MDHTATLALISCFTSIAGLAWYRIYGRAALRTGLPVLRHWSRIRVSILRTASLAQEAYGDVICLPNEMRRAANTSPGERAVKAARAQRRTRNVRTHSGAGI